MKTTIALAIAALALAPPASAKKAAQAPPARAWSLPDRELMVPVEGGRVWVSINGDLNAAAAPVIFIHGGPGSTHTAFGGLTALADHRAVILYDQLDSGMSDHPENPANWRVERFVSELEAIRKALNVERWHVVGHSWGSAIALEYAARYPTHVASTVLGGTFISAPHWILGTNLLIRDLPLEVQKDILACESDRRPPAATCQAAETAFYAAHNGRPDAPPPSPEARAYVERTKGKGFNGKLYNAMWGPSEFSAQGMLATYDGTPLLAKLDGKRTLFMVGQFDEARLDTVRDYVRLTAGAEMAVVPGGSHAFYAERPAETAGLLRGWLSRKDAK
ncbi:proline iminopeptidase/L-proline amide hydrolase [Sphingomonas kaistensis]|uniref:Proline iminopeptidase/L-proline amide hydrolase n=1 Tax=Sphingomonas kaistensis TaxID=298708 RepID=A0A7X5Y6G7_9SPHN|nr:proline iminopeptidase-family hydrolase [Sphingomonas kaistensis]NJC06074.1 proline iminopeptidase/L-proline amide hydrolase [Sphingomonas kaistensis]